MGRTTMRMSPAQPVATGPAAFAAHRTAAAPRRLRGGCWLMSIVPIAGVPLDGTLRVDRHGSGCTISGDLYRRRRAPPQPDGRVPVFPIADYAQYVGATALDEESDPAGVRLALRVVKFSNRPAWIDAGGVSARLGWVRAPAPFPSGTEYLEGDVTGADGRIVAHMSLGWISPRLRRVTVEIDTVSGCERPVDNGAGFGWHELFDALNWDGTVRLSDTDVVEPAGGVWPLAELHKAMCARREHVDLNSEWRYHILSVRRTAEVDRGLMYDAMGTDANGIPREGCALAAHWPVPATPQWGEAGGRRFGVSNAAFFRAAVHELGHAFGLDHNAHDLGFMNTTDVISEQGSAGLPFPRNIGWAFAPGDVVRLRHDPDIMVRPGGVPADGPRSGTPRPLADEAVEPDGVRLDVSPLLGEVPIGAPVRVKIALVNEGSGAHTVPARLSLKSGCVSGRVIDPAGTMRGFSAILGCVEEQALRRLAPGERLEYDLTLLRGPDGALFPAPGLYRIEVDVHWTGPATVQGLTGATTLFVTATRTSAHAAAAHRVLATPELHLVLVLGGDHLREGLDALDAALANTVLAPHYAAIELRRRQSAANSGGGARLPAAIVMSDSERNKIVRAGQQVRSKSRRSKSATAAVDNAGEPPARKSRHSARNHRAETGPVR